MQNRYIKRSFATAVNIIRLSLLNQFDCVMFRFRYPLMGRAVVRHRRQIPPAILRE